MRLLREYLRCGDTWRETAILGVSDTGFGYMWGKVLLVYPSTGYIVGTLTTIVIDPTRCEKWKYEELSDEEAAAVLLSTQGG